MKTFRQFLSEMQMKQIASGIEIPVPGKPPGKPKASGPLVPPAKPKAPELKPLTLGQGVRKSAQITTMAKTISDELERSRARKAVDREREKDAKEARQPTRPAVPPQGI